MIPSRPLSFVESIGETISIVRRIFLRYGLFFVLFLAPGIGVFTIGAGNLSRDIITSIHTDLHYSDTEVASLRDEGRVWVREHSPLFEQEEEMMGVHDSLASNGYPHVQQVRSYLKGHLIDFPEIIWIIVGGILVLLGAVACVASTIDLAGCVFEERPQEIWETVKTVFVRHLWRTLLLYAIYWLVTLAIDLLLSISGALSIYLEAFFSSITLILEVWIALRLMTALPALVSEELGPIAAIRRSWHLTRGSGLQIIGKSIAIGILLFLCTLAVSLIASPLFGSVMHLISTIVRDRSLSYFWLIDAVPSVVRGLLLECTLFTFLLTPILPVFLTVLYYDLRTRRDGPLVYLD
jgi:hypothetical protein